MPSPAPPASPLVFPLPGVMRQQAASPPAPCRRLNGNKSCGRQPVPLGPCTNRRRRNHQAQRAAARRAAAGSRAARPATTMRTSSAGCSRYHATRRGGCCLSPVPKSLRGNSREASPRGQAPAAGRQSASPRPEVARRRPVAGTSRRQISSLAPREATARAGSQAATS